MSERLGEALLEIRTNDAGFIAGVQQAEAKAQRLGAQLDKTSGSSAKLADELTATGRSAAVMSTGFEAASTKVTASVGAQRQGMQQLGLQLGDIATMYSLGARPAQIFATQIGQVTQAVQLMAGGTSRLAAFLGGPWGIALSVGVIALSPFISRLFEAEDALKGVELASDKMGDAQAILGRVIDATTLKMKEQTGHAIALARAQAAVGLSDAMTRLANARAEQRSISQGGLGDLRVEGTMGGLRLTRANNGQDLVDGYRNGKLTAEQVEAQARARMNAGVITPEAYRRLLSVPNEVAEAKNVKLFQDTLDALLGDKEAARRVFGPGGTGGSGGGGGGRGGSGGGGGGRGTASRGSAQEAVDARFESDLIAITQRILQARLKIAVSADERAELAERGVEWDRRDALKAIEERKGLKEAEREELRAATNRLADAEIEAIQFTKRAELAREAQTLADERFRGEQQALQIAGQLADTEAERRDIALRLYDAQLEMERLALQTIVDMAARGEIEKREGDLAAQRLANLEANAAGGRSAVARQNETEAQRYLRNLNATPGMINEAIEGIKIDGLEALNDGLVKAITGVQSLGDVFSRVADQIIADLLRIAIQQAIIRPLAGALFGGGGGGFLGRLFGGGGPSASLLGSVNSLFGGPFAGLFAKGGTIPTGQFGIVGEAGPELAFAGPGGMGILSNSDSKALLGGVARTSITIPINIDATGADAAAIARLNSKLDQLRAELPGTIVTTVQEARDRRVIR